MGLDPSADKILANQPQLLHDQPMPQPLKHTVILVLVLFHLHSQTAADETVETWKAAASKVRITPDQPMWMAGYAARNRPADGTLTDLWAKVLVLQDAKSTTTVLISSISSARPKFSADQSAKPLKKQQHSCEPRLHLQVRTPIPGPHCGTTSVPFTT